MGCHVIKNPMILRQRKTDKLVEKYRNLHILEINVEYPKNCTGSVTSFHNWGRE